MQGQISLVLHYFINETKTPVATAASKTTPGFLKKLHPGIAGAFLSLLHPGSQTLHRFFLEAGHITAGDSEDVCDLLLAERFIPVKPIS